MKNLEAEKLLQKYIAGKCSYREIAMLETWYLNNNLNETLDLSSEQRTNDLKEVWELLKVETEFPSEQKVKLWPRIPVTAAILLIFMGGLLYQMNKPIHLKQQSTKDILAPVGNKAFLTLSNGKRIELSHIKNGEIAIQSGVEITKTPNGELEYKNSKSINKAIVNKDYNMIETQNGGQYNFTLPDGTRVWLNSSSNIQYPTSFANREERRVKLLGEAYFQVSKDKDHPFIVQTNNQEVKVLGTHFNLMAYPDEHVINTTLLEGSVQVSHGGLKKNLKPGQQSKLIDNQLSILDVTPEDAIAWKAGLFKFENADVKTVFRQLSRWYDVEIIYEGNVKKYHFTGEIHKNLSLSKALQGLIFTGLKFKVNGRRIIVEHEN